MSLITGLFSLSKLFLIFTSAKFFIYVYSLEPGTWTDEISSVFIYFVFNIYFVIIFPLYYPHF